MSSRSMNVAEKVRDLLENEIILKKPVMRAVDHGIKMLKDEYKTTFKNKEYELSIEITSPNEVIVTVDINRFLSDHHADQTEFDVLMESVIDAGIQSGATRSENYNSFFAGPLAGMLIKRGKTIDADSLLSVVSIVWNYPVNFK